MSRCDQVVLLGGLIFEKSTPHLQFVPQELLALMCLYIILPM